MTDERRAAALERLYEAVIEARETNKTYIRPTAPDMNRYWAAEVSVGDALADVVALPPAQAPSVPSAEAVAKSLWRALLTEKDEEAGLPYLGVNPDEETPTLDYDEAAIISLFVSALDAFATARGAQAPEGGEREAWLEKFYEAAQYWKIEPHDQKERQAFVTKIISLGSGASQSDTETPMDYAPPLVPDGVLDGPQGALADARAAIREADQLLAEATFSQPISWHKRFDEWMKSSVVREARTPPEGTHREEQG